MNGALLWIAGLIVVLLAALFAVPYAVDWNAYRGVFETEASRMLGREVRVGGDVSLRLLPAPYISFEKPRIADATAGEAFFRADSFTMWLALPPLLQGIVEARQVEIERPVLRLQIHENGGGNWRTFKISRADLPFVPRGLTLQSVKITDGIIAVHGVSGEPLAKIEIAEGELSAPALEGPYRLRADVRWNDDIREVRASTAPPDPDGSTRLKLAVRAPKSGNAYTFDGRIVDLVGRPQFDGSFTATIPVTSGTGELRPTTVQSADSEAIPPAALHSGVFEVRAAVSANAVSAKLSDLGFSFEQNGQPQLLTGTAEASWLQKPVIRATLTSRWLDLDRIADVPSNSNALQALRSLASSVTGFLPTQADVAARLTIDQATLAGDMVSNLVVAIENAGAGLTIKEFHAALPGGSRVDVTGALTGSGTAEAFDGEILVRGANLNRFLAWAARGTQFADAPSDAGFALSGQLSLGPGRLELSKASIDSGPNRLEGEITYRWDGRRNLVLSLETSRADISGVLPGVLGPDLLKAKLGALTGSDGGNLNSLLAGLAGIDLSMHIRADALTDGARMLHNVDADVRLEDGRLRIPVFRASTPEGFKLELDGDVRDFAGEPKGALQGTIEAPTRAALSEALDLAADDIDGERRQWLAALAPLRLAFVSRFGQPPGERVVMTIDGTSHGEHLVATLVLEGGLAEWRSKPADLMLTSESNEVARVVRGLLLGGTEEREARSTLPKGRLLVKAAGVPEKDAAIFVQMIAGDDLQLLLQGRGALPANGSPTFKGEMEVAAENSGRALHFAGIPLPANAVEGGLKGRAAVTVADHALTFALDRFEVGKVRLSGEAKLGGTSETRTLDLDLKADSASLPRLLALALDTEIQTSEIPADIAQLSQWQDQPFDFSNLEHVNGSLNLKADTLALGQGFELADAVLEAQIEPGRITITKLEGRALGGAVSGAFKLEKTAAGGQMSGAFGLWDIRLDHIKGASNAPIGAGSLRLTLQVNGQAVTPRALIPVLTGKGELQFRNARWERLSAKAIEAAADAVLSGDTAPTGEPLRQALRTALAREPLLLGDLKIPVVVGAGALRIDGFTVETPEAQIINRTTIDLTEVAIDSEWKLQPKATRGGGTPLPGISVVYVGPLKSIASLEPQLFIDMLERELAVRNMERDVEHLEQLRREDEARAKAEAERLRKLEEERLMQFQELQGAQGLTIDVPFPFPASPSTAPAPQSLTIEPETPSQHPQPAAPQQRITPQWDGQRPPPERSGTSAPASSAPEVRRAL
jgi:hypothetical protein